MATSVDRPWWLEPNRVRVTLTTGALERVDVAAKSMGVRRGRVLDALLRVASVDDMQAAVSAVNDHDAKALTAWRESCIPS